jgi:hypothetical protein
MPTKFGKKSKPVFKIVEWRNDGPQEPQPVPTPPAPPQIKPPVQSAADIDDDIPF